MKTSRFALCLTLILLLLLSLSPLALAETTTAGNSAAATGVEDGSVFLAGSNTSSIAQVRGILFSAGNSVSGGGAFEYALLAGNDVSLSGNCENDAFLAGRSVSATGQIARDLYAAAQTVRISGTVARDLYAAGQTVVIDGSVGGDVYLSADSIVIGDDAEIAGTLHYNSSAEIKAPQAVLSKAETYVSEKAEPEAKVDTPKSPSVWDRIKGKINPFVGLLLLGFALLWLTPLWEAVDSRFTGAPFGQYAKAFGIGFAVLVGLPIAAILLMITGFGLRPAFVLLLLYAALLLIAPLFIGFFAGVLIWRGALKRPVNRWYELGLGLLAWRLVTLIPGIKALVGFVTAPLALGVVAMLLGRKKEPVPAEPDSFAAEPEVPETPAPAPETPILPAEPAAPAAEPEAFTEAEAPAIEAESPVEPEAPAEPEPPVIEAAEPEAPAPEAEAPELPPEE